MRFRKYLSVLLAAVMLFSVMSVGFTAMAAETEYQEYYDALAQALKNDYVNDLTNYTVTKTIPDDEDGGFNSETRSFYYDHVVIAEDNGEKLILKASNSFYCLAELLMSKKYGQGCYDAATLVDTVASVLKEDYFNSDIVTADGTMMNEWDYYNVDTILSYFMGNVLSINASNWFHSFAFVVETSLNTVLAECNGLDSVPEEIKLVTAVYEFRYKSVYNESMSRAYYSFDASSLENVWEKYGSEYNLDRTSADVFGEAQAEAYLIKVDVDTDTKTTLRRIYDEFNGVIGLKDTAAGEKWDEDLDLSDEAAAKIKADINTLTENFSNEALISVFGETLGNMFVLANNTKTTAEMPERTVYGTDGYVAVNKTSSEKLNGIIDELDSLFSPETAEEKSVSQRVCYAVKQFLNESAVLAADANSLEELMSVLVDSYLISDSTINMLIGEIYPVFAAMLSSSEAATLATELGLALTPAALAEKLDGTKYGEAKAELSATHIWNNVVYNRVVWGVNSEKSFVEAFLAAFSGIEPLLNCLLGDEANGNVSVYDSAAVLKAQDLYEKLLIPVFGLIGVSDYAVGYSSLEDIITPVVSWITDVFAKQPLGTVLTVIPTFAAELSKENNIFVSALKDTGLKVEVSGEVNDLGSLAVLLGEEINSFTSIDAFVSAFFRITYIDSLGRYQPVLFPVLPEKELAALGSDVENNKAETLVLLARYVLSSFGYKANDKEPAILDCLGINLKDTFANGQTVRDFITGIMIRSDEVICAVAEFLTTSETGNFYEGKDYFYEISEIDYHDGTLLNRIINPTLMFGTEVKYSEYWTEEYADELAQSFEPLLTDLLVMFGVEGAENGLGYLIRAKLVEKIFNNDTINAVFNTIYQFVADYNEGSDASISELLYVMFGASVTPVKLADSLDEMMGRRTSASRVIRSAASWDELFKATAGEDNTPVFTDVNLDWGIYDDEANDMTVEDAFFRTISALLTPFSFIVKNALLDEDLSVLGIADIPGYAGYQYAYIALLETLMCPDVLTYKEYYKSVQENESNAFYNLFTPVIGLLENIYKAPVDTLKSVVPNILFFASIGGFNDLINNFSHSLYVLADTLSPIVDVYSLLDEYLSDMEVGDRTLNISLPLDLDFDELLSILSDMLIGDTFTVTGVSLKMPVVDLYTLCVGTVTYYRSKDGRRAVYLDVGNGGIQLTCAVRTLSEILFYEENHEALGQIVKNLVDNGKFDDYDAETITLIANAIMGMVEEYQMIDMVLFVVHLLATNLVPITGSVADKFFESGLTVQILFASVGNMDEFIENVKIIAGLGGSEELPGGAVGDIDAVSGLFGRIGDFFNRIWTFIQNFLHSILPFIW